MGDAVSDASRRNRAAAEMALAGTPTRASALLLLLERGELVAGQFLAGLGPARSASARHAALLEAGGLVARRRAGGHSVYALTDRGRLVAEAVRDLGGIGRR